MDLTVTNDYTSDSMLKGCDKVIDFINKQFGTQEAVKTSSRKSANDLSKKLGFSRIEEGATRVEDYELFKQQTVHDFEK